MSASSLAVGWTSAKPVLSRGIYRELHRVHRAIDDHRMI
jgi:hypothetical protein